MKRLNKILKPILVLTSALILPILSIAQCPNIVWADEFSGSSLDESKWNYQTGDGCAENICGWGNGELQSYQEANVTVSDGTLKITARKQRIRGSKYTSGRINSKGKGDFSYGRMEALIKLPVGDGLWPAFWMLSTNEPFGGWPQSGEIDIMEFTASQPDEIYGTIHYGDPSPANQFQGNDFILSSGSFPENYHEFAIEWEPGEIRWYMDGILYSTKTTADVAPYNWPFDNNDFHFLLNVAVGGTLGGPVNDNMLPATMEVDYVRVYDGFKPYISGDRIVLNQAQNKTYQIGNVSNNTNVTWSVPSGATIVSGQGTNEVTVNFGNDGGIITATFNNGCTSQVLNIDVTVEAPFAKAFSFENFDEPGTANFSLATGTLNEVANPAPNGVNGSALSGEYVRNSAEQYDVVVYNVSNISDASAYVQNQKKFFVDIYTSAPVGTEIILQLETPAAATSDFPGGRHSRYVATTTQTNGWERLAFTFFDRPDSGASDSGISNLVLLFASNSFTGDTYYFDNLDSYDLDDGSSGNNQAPSVSITSPNDGASYDEGTSISISANASDSDGAVTSVEFFADGNSLGVDNTAPYSINWTVPLGSTVLTAEATDDEGASTTSQAVDVTGNAVGGGNPTSIRVASISTGTVSAGQGRKYGRATVLVVDDLNNPIQNATVNGTFSGTFNEQASGVTNSSGEVTLQTQGTAKGSVTVVFCVDDVIYGPLPYDAASNVVSCSNEGGALIGNRLPFESQAELAVFPNPATDQLNIRIQDITRYNKISILDMKGSQLFTTEVISNYAEINLQHLKPGVYLLSLQQQDGNLQSIKFVKE